jgi:hypothetical protein
VAAAALTGVLAVVATISVLLIAGRTSARRQAAISPHLIGRLPLTTGPINEIGFQLLIRAAGIVSESVALDKLEANMQDRALAWLTLVETTRTENGFTDLLKAAGDLMIRIQTSDALCALLPEDTRKRLDNWIKDFAR